MSEDTEETKTRVTRGALRRASVEQKESPATPDTPKRGVPKKVGVLSSIDETATPIEDPSLDKLKAEAKSGRESPKLRGRKPIHTDSPATTIKLKEIEEEKETPKRSTRAASLTKENLETLNTPENAPKSARKRRVSTDSAEIVPVRRSARRNSITSEEGSINNIPTTTPKTRNKGRLSVAPTQTPILEDEESNDLDIKKLRNRSISSPVSPKKDKMKPLKIELVSLNMNKGDVLDVSDSGSITGPEKPQEEIMMETPQKETGKKNVTFDGTEIDQSKPTFPKTPRSSVKAKIEEDPTSEAEDNIFEDSDQLLDVSLENIALKIGDNLNTPNLETTILKTPNVEAKTKVSQVQNQIMSCSTPKSVETPKFVKSWGQSVSGMAEKDVIDAFGVKKEEEETKKVEVVEEKTAEIAEESEEGEKEKKNSFVEDEAMEVDGYESGDSKSSSLKECLKKNEIPEHGETITDDEDNSCEEDEEYENDSFIVDEEEEDELLEGTGDELDSNSGKSGKKKAKPRKRIQTVLDSSDEEKEKEKKKKVVEVDLLTEEESGESYDIVKNSGKKSKQLSSDEEAESFETSKSILSPDLIEKNAEKAAPATPKASNLSEKKTVTPKSSPKATKEAEDKVQASPNQSKTIEDSSKQSAAVEETPKTSPAASKIAASPKSAKGTPKAAKTVEKIIEITPASPTIPKSKEVSPTIQITPVCSSVSKAGAKLSSALAITPKQAAIKLSPAASNPAATSKPSSVDMASSKDSPALEDAGKNTPKKSPAKATEATAVKLQETPKASPIALKLAGDYSPTQSPLKLQGSTPKPSPIASKILKMKETPSKPTFTEAQIEASPEKSVESPTKCASTASIHIEGIVKLNKTVVEEGKEGNLDDSGDETPPLFVEEDSDEGKEETSVDSNQNKKEKEEKTSPQVLDEENDKEMPSQGKVVKGRKSMPPVLHDISSTLSAKKQKRNTINAINVEDDLPAPPLSVKKVKKLDESGAKSSAKKLKLDESVTKSAKKVAKPESAKKKAKSATALGPREFNIDAILEKCNEFLRVDKEKKKTNQGLLRQRKEEKKKLKEIQKAEEAAATVLEGAEESPEKKKKKKKKIKKVNYLLEELGETKKEHISAKLKKKQETIELKRLKKKEKKSVKNILKVENGEETKKKKKATPKVPVPVPTEKSKMKGKEEREEEPIKVNLVSAFSVLKAPLLNAASENDEVVPATKTQKVSKEKPEAKKSKKEVAEITVVKKSDRKDKTVVDVEIKKKKKERYFDEEKDENDGSVTNVAKKSSKIIVEKEPAVKVKKTKSKSQKVEQEVTPKKSKLNIVRQISSGLLFEEPMTPKEVMLKRNRGFIEEPASPRTPKGFKVTNIFPAGQDDFKPQTENPKRKKDKVIIVEPSKALPQPVWTASGAFEVEDAEARMKKKRKHNNDDGDYIALASIPSSSTEFLLKPLSSKRTKGGQIDTNLLSQDALSFKKKALIDKNAHLRTAVKRH